MKNKFFSSLLAVLISVTAFSQRDSNNSPTLIGTSVNMYNVEPLESRLSSLKIACSKLKLNLKWKPWGHL